MTDAQIVDLYNSGKIDFTDSQLLEMARTGTNQSVPASVNVATQNSKEMPSALSWVLDKMDAANKFMENPVGNTVAGFLGVAKQFMGGGVNSDYDGKFVAAMETLVGMPYYLGGGNIDEYDGMTNKDDAGNWLGYDCVGGVMSKLREVSSKQIAIMEQNGLINQSWVEKINENELKPGCLIFHDVENYSANKAGVYDHVMTYLGNGKVISTTPGNGDV
jgi:cell wall-associated NlpC family hydrolase